MKIHTQEIYLNPEQEKAVSHMHGPLLIIAGAGSGKTRIITTRIANLMANHRISASAIVALTFTNKAAQQMKERIIGFIGSDQDIPFVGTFHSYCVRLLKQHRHLVPTPFFGILDDDDQKKLITDILKRHSAGSHIASRQAAYYISQVKNKNSNVDKSLHHLFDHPLMPAIYQAYEEEKRLSKMLDFDDLLLETVQLFKHNVDFKQQFQTIVRHLLIDEYQDTNIVQHELLRQMALHNKKIAIDSLCAVGDEDQSIYSWRGATIANMLNFQKDFPYTTIIKIEQNYRSVQPILEAANHVIQHNTQRNPKKLWSNRPASYRITLLTCVSEYQEADAIMQCIKTVRHTHPLQEIAVLYRTHAQSRAIEESLIKNSIAYRIIGGIQFYERKEIKDLFAYLKLIANPFDRASLFRILNSPTRGFGEKFEEQLYEILKVQPFLPFHDAFLVLSTQLPPSKQQSIQAFIAIFSGLSPQDKPYRTLQHIIERTHYLAFTKKQYEPEDAQTRLENIQELLDAIAYFETQHITTITGLLEEVTLMQEKLTSSDNELNKVLLMTLHAAKGLEFDTVILAGIEQGILPTTRALYEQEMSLEEERRLLYVGITRAKERLILTHTKFRHTYGTVSEQQPSQFLRELPESLITKEDCSYWNNARFAHYFTQWFNPRYSTKISSPESNVTRPAPIATTAAQLIFYVHQTVTHHTYGRGIVQGVEQRVNSSVITVKFKSGIKKISAQFLKR